MVNNFKEVTTDLSEKWCFCTLIHFPTLISKWISYERKGVTEITQAAEGEYKAVNGQGQTGETSLPSVIEKEK